MSEGALRKRTRGQAAEVAPAPAERPLRPDPPPPFARYWNKLVKCTDKIGNELLCPITRELPIEPRFAMRCTALSALRSRGARDVNVGRAARGDAGPRVSREI